LDKFNEENIIDTNYEEIIDEGLFETDININREPLYYNCMQVAKILDEPDSKIRYWSKMFQPLLNIPISNNNRKYTKSNIENLMFIRKLLKEDGLTVKQAYDYCSQKGFNNEIGLDTGNPLAIKTFISGLTDEMDKKFIEMQNITIKQQQDMINILQNIIKENNIALKEGIINTIDEVVSDKMNGYFDSLQNELSITQETNRRVEENLDNNNKIISENTKAINEFKCLNLEQIKNQQEPKSFISKIFNFKK
jgi:DNA-binding transcriptional MerR regulator